MSEVKPALTAEEWAGKQIRDSTGALDLGAQDFFGLTVNGVFNEDRRLALGALALKGCFTWEHVDMLRSDLGDAVFRFGPESVHDPRHLLRLQLADLIESLLPPREGS